PQPAATHSSLRHTPGPPRRVQLVSSAGGVPSVQRFSAPQVWVPVQGSASSHALASLQSKLQPLHPSKLIVLPSSHCSLGEVTTPSPQTLPTHAPPMQMLPGAQPTPSALLAQSIGPASARAPSIALSSPGATGPPH